VVDDTQETPTMELQTDAPTKKAPARKKSPHPTAKGAGPTAFSIYCKEHKIDGVKARRALRAAGMHAPYDPKSKRVLDILRNL
jgi:hypothetical protein